MIELNAFFLSEFFGKVVIELLLVGGIFQRCTDQINLIEIQLNVISASDYRQYSDRFLILVVSVLLRLLLIMVLTVLGLLILFLILVFPCLLILFLILVLFGFAGFLVNFFF